MASDSARCYALRKQLMLGGGLIQLVGPPSSGKSSTLLRCLEEHLEPPPPQQGTEMNTADFIGGGAVTDTSIANASGRVLLVSGRTLHSEYQFRKRLHAELLSLKLSEESTAAFKATLKKRYALLRRSGDDNAHDGDMADREDDGAVDDDNLALLRGSTTTGLGTSKRLKKGDTMDGTDNGGGGLVESCYASVSYLMQSMFLSLGKDLHIVVEDADLSGDPRFLSSSGGGGGSDSSSDANGKLLFVSGDRCGAGLLRWSQRLIWECDKKVNFSSKLMHSMHRSATSSDARLFVWLVSQRVISGPVGDGGCHRIVPFGRPFGAAAFESIRQIASAAVDASSMGSTVRDVRDARLVTGAKREREKLEGDGNEKESVDEDPAERKQKRKAVLVDAMSNLATWYTIKPPTRQVVATVQTLPLIARTAEAASWLLSSKHDAGALFDPSRDPLGAAQAWTATSSRGGMDAMLAHVSSSSSRNNGSDAGMESGGGASGATSLLMTQPASVKVLYLAAFWCGAINVVADQEVFGNYSSSSARLSRRRGKRAAAQMTSTTSANRSKVGSSSNDHALTINSLIDSLSSSTFPIHLHRVLSVARALAWVVSDDAVRLETKRVTDWESEDRRLLFPFLPASDFQDPATESYGGSAFGEANTEEGTSTVLTDGVVLPATLARHWNLLLSAGIVAPIRSSSTAAVGLGGRAVGYQANIGLDPAKSVASSLGIQLESLIPRR